MSYRGLRAMNAAVCPQLSDGSIAAVAAHRLCLPGKIVRHRFKESAHASARPPHAARRRAAAPAIGRRLRPPTRAEPGSVRGDRARHHRGALPVAVGRVSAGIRERGLAARLPAPHSGRARRAGELRHRVCLLPRARRLLAAACACSPSAARRRGATSCCSRSPTSRASRRPRAPQGRDRRARRSAPHRCRRGRRALVAAARPIYYINAGLHSDETGSTESVLELAYRLAVSEQPMIRRIREQRRGADQPDRQSRRARQAGRVVLPISQGQDRRGDAAAPGAAVLVDATPSSTSIATRTSRCTRPPARCSACSSTGTRR